MEAKKNEDSEATELIEKLFDIYLYNYVKRCITRSQPSAVAIQKMNESIERHIEWFKQHILIPLNMEHGFDLFTNLCFERVSEASVLEIKEKIKNEAVYHSLSLLLDQIL